MKSRVAFGFAIAVLLTGTAVYFGRSWLPPAANHFAAEFDAAWKLNLLAFAILFVLTHVGLAAWVLRGNVDKHPRQPTWRSEVAWAALALVLFVGLAAASAHTWEREKPLGARPTAVQVEVVGQQFRWYFRYPGPDGKFGRTDLHLADAAEGNPLGLDRRDPAAQDDRLTTSLVLPAGKDIQLDLRSYDVIHSFFIPELRFKQDAVPGMAIPIHFSFARPGEYEIACAELCGLGHHQMNAKVRVLSPSDFRAWEATP